MKNSIKTYNQVTQFIESLSNIAPLQKDKTVKTAKERLENVKRFLEFLGNPEKKLKIIHVAGTSGKGSVVTMLHSILDEAGKKVGSYTSPHTTTYCERIKIGNKYISEKELVETTNFLKNKMDEYTYNLQPTTYNLSLNFFEFSFCLAVYYFSQQNCKYAVIETGCGGRYDASNAIKKPTYTIITNIGRDHLDIFGSLENIAKEKAGIIKKNTPCLTGETDRRWLGFFKKEFSLLHCYIFTLLKKINYKDLKNVKTSLDGTSFEYKNKKYKLQMIGAHQARNATLAIECINNLQLSGAKYSIVKKGLEKAFYPARMEVIQKNPTIIIDGAHNSDKLKACFEFIKNQESGIRNKGKKYLILGMAKNKKIKNISKLFNFFDKVYLTRFSNPFRKVINYNDWMTIFAKKPKNDIYYKHYAKDALLDILPKLRKNDLLVITGSIFLAGEMREYWYNTEEIVRRRKSKW